MLIIEPSCHRFDRLSGNISKAVLGLRAPNGSALLLSQIIDRDIDHVKILVAELRLHMHSDAQR